MLINDRCRVSNGSSRRFISHLCFIFFFFIPAAIKRQISRANRVIGAISSARKAINLLFTGARAS